MSDSQALFLELILILLVSAVFLYIYFIPTSVAINKKQVNYFSIFVINLFLGWTIVGWIICLAWAVKK